MADILDNLSEEFSSKLVLAPGDAEKFCQFVSRAEKFCQFVSRAEKFCQFVSRAENSKIVLLRQKEVCQWLFGELAFLQLATDKNKAIMAAKNKMLEDKWGQTTLKTKRPDLKLDKQWTNKFGEHICEELFELLGKNVSKPTKKENYQPDLEIDDAIIEVKTCTYFTHGTANEKILGAPFKYADVPHLYGKPLRVLCVGGAEKICREQYGNLPGAKCSPQKKKFLEFFAENKIEFIGISDLLNAASLQSKLHQS